MDYAREELLRQRQALAALLMGGGAPERQEAQAEGDRAEIWTEAGAEDAGFPVERAGRKSPVSGMALRTAREPASEAELRMVREPVSEAELRRTRQAAGTAERPPETVEGAFEMAWGQTKAAAVWSGGRRSGFGSSAAAAAVRHRSAAVGGMRLAVPGGLEPGTAGGSGTADVLWTAGRTAPAEGGVDLRAVSRAVERDARRYDGGFTIY